MRNQAIDRLVRLRLVEVREAVRGEYPEFIAAVSVMMLPPSPDALPGALLWAAAILAVCAPLAVWRYGGG